MSARSANQRQRQHQHRMSMMTTRIKVRAMDGLREIQQTLREIDRRIPNALRAAFGLGYRVVLSPPIKGEDLDSFVASVLPPSISEDRDHHRTELDELPFAREDCIQDDVPEDDASRRALRMDWASCYLPEPYSDHDAHFGVAELGVIGVADGVGSYREIGVDPGEFSRSLMEIARKKLPLAPGEPICPYTLLEHAYDETVRSRKPGGSTALVISLVGDKLRWANLGDSGFAVLRGGTVVHRSQPQYSGRSDCPFQLATKEGWSVTEAEVGETPVREGDVVVVGTDGLLDNMFDAELERVVRMGTALGFSPKNMADIVAGIAFEVSFCGSKDSPYSVSHRKRRGTAQHGGKQDDITVVVAFIGSTAQLAGVDKTEDDGVTSNWMDEVQRKKMAREQIRAAACRARVLNRRPAERRSVSARRARPSARSVVVGW